MNLKKNREWFSGHPDKIKPDNIKPDNIKSDKKLNRTLNSGADKEKYYEG